MADVKPTPANNPFIKEAMEKALVQERLKKKYPQMFQSGWGGRVAQAIKGARTKETGSSQHRMGMSITTPDDLVAINKSRDKQYK